MYLMYVLILQTGSLHYDYEMNPSYGEAVKPTTNPAYAMVKSEEKSGDNDSDTYEAVWQCKQDFVI